MSSTKYPGREIRKLVSDRVYGGEVNVPLVDLLHGNCGRILDVGCGAGDNAALIKSRNSDCEVFGITHSATEATRAQAHMAKCWLADIEGDLPEDLGNQLFDVLVFSHVLEHLRRPDEILARFSRLLHRGGQVLIAVPNILSWRMRVQFLRGDFKYIPGGVLDDTHLRFFTYFTADRHLLSECSDLELIEKAVTGNVPLWWLRRHVFPKVWSEGIDRWGCRHWPNLMGHQILMRAVKR